VKRTAKPRPHSAASLFAEPERPTGMHVAHIDGGSRGNPGPASYAVVVRAPDGSTQFRIGKYLGRATNNVAEYYGLIGALDYAQQHNISRLVIRSDSELLVRQMQGRYKVKSADLRPLFERAQKMARSLAHFEILHVPRELNSEADELANLALDATGTVGGAVSAARERSPAEAPPAKPEAATAREKAATKSAPQKDGRKIRARFSAGALHPLEALDLTEGEIVEISVRKPAPN
jgi:probable phosphoglycerate mutase